MTEQMGLELCYLAGCALKGLRPEEKRTAGLDLRQIYRMAKFHNLTTLVYIALESASVLEQCGDMELIRSWKEAKEKAVRKAILLNVEREEILNAMESRGIWYLPLKGILLQELYPQPGMRQMADNDILYDIHFQNKLLAYMKARGYKAVSIGEGCHDVYQKPPVYNFEMHTVLYGKMHKKEWMDYYADVKERLILDQGRKYAYHFTQEDFYVYFITHLNKHYDGAGTGLRSLMDCYVYLEKWERELDWTYITGELEKLGLAEFEAQCRKLCRKIFVTEEKANLEEQERNMFKLLISSGTYGTVRNKVKKEMRTVAADGEKITNWVKLKYCLRRLFPDQDHIKAYCPIAWRYKCLIPFYFIFRLVRGVTVRRKKVDREMKEVRELH